MFIKHKKVGGGLDRRESHSSNKQKLFSKYKKCIKNSYKYAICVKPQKSTTKRTLAWLLALCMWFVLALQPLFALRPQSTDAGWTSGGIVYDNTAMYLAKSSGATQITSKTEYESSDALFKADGSINIDVLKTLLEMVKDSKVWGSKSVPTDDSVTYLSAKDFGKYGDQSAWSDEKKGNAQLVVKLFDDTVSGLSTNATSAAKQLWQVVYRSVSATEDVLTLYMTGNYLSDIEYNNAYGDYMNSNVRDLILATYNDTANSGLSQIFTQLSNYVVAPSALPGEWQSNAYQTSGNNSNEYYNETNTASLGSSAYATSSSFYLQNGLDDTALLYGKTSTGWGRTDSSNKTAYNDMLWMPSSFEALHTGYKTSEQVSLQDTGRSFDGENTVSYVSSISSSNATLSKVASGTDGRTGLWELNGYDRAIGVYVWLRSGFSSNYYGASGIASGGSYTGSFNVFNSYGVRVALHLNLKSLAEYQNYLESGVNFIVTADNTENNVAVLSIFKSNGSKYEIVQQVYVLKRDEKQSFVVILEKDVTYLLVISKPYFWNVTYSGDGTQTADGWQFTTGGTAVSIYISGGGDMNNSIVV